MFEHLWQLLAEKLPRWFWQLILLLLATLIWPWLARRLGWSSSASEQELSPQQQQQLFDLFLQQTQLNEETP